MCHRILTGLEQRVLIGFKRSELCNSIKNDSGVRYQGIDSKRRKAEPVSKDFFFLFVLRFKCWCRWLSVCALRLAGDQSGVDPTSRFNSARRGNSTAVTPTRIRSIENGRLDGSLRGRNHRCECSKYVSRSRR